MSASFKNLAGTVILIRCVFSKLPWPEDREKTFRSSSQALRLSTTHGRGFTLSLLLLNVKLGIAIFMVFGLTGPRIEAESTVSVADALSTRPLIGINLKICLKRILNTSSKTDCIESFRRWQIFKKFCNNHFSEETKSLLRAKSHLREFAQATHGVTREHSKSVRLQHQACELTLAIENSESVSGCTTSVKVFEK